MKFAANLKITELLSGAERRFEGVGLNINSKEVAITPLGDNPPIVCRKPILFPRAKYMLITAWNNDFTRKYRIEVTEMVMTKEYP